MATPDIIVQVKGGQTSVITAPTGSATRLVQLADVSTTGLTDGQVLTYVAANGRYEFAVPTGAPSPDVYARPHANGAFDHANGAFNKANTSNVLSVAGKTGVVTLNTEDLIAGTLGVVRGGTGFTTYANGDLLIGNTLSGGLDRANLTHGYGILITNTNGSIKIEAASGKNYYFNYSNTADVAGYHTAPISPSPNAENSATILCTTALVFNLVGSFITDVGEPGTTVLPAGAYGRHFHATTDGANNVGRLRVEVYKRAANGQETLIRTNDSPDFNSTNATIVETWGITDPISHPLDLSDRLVFKIYAARVSGGSGSINITIYFEGLSRASFATTSINSAGGDSTAREMVTAAFNKANGAVQNGFTTINVAGQSNVVADSNTDTLTFVAGSNMTITTDAANDTVTFASTGGGATAEWDFVSANISFTSGYAVISASHGLAGQPTSFDALLVCVGTGGEGSFGWNIGEVIAARGNHHSTTYALNYMGADATKVYFFISSLGGNLIVPTKTTGAVNVIGTLSNWALRLLARYRP